MKLDEKEQAIRMRKQGSSLKEVAAQLHIAKSTASLWLRDVPLSKRAQNILKEKYTKGQLAASKAKRTETARRLATAQMLGEKTVQNSCMNEEAEKVLCAMIYWCEGRKSQNDRDLAFTNSDPYLVKIFLGLLRKSFAIDESKFNVNIHLHEYHNQDTQLQFWSETTTIPLCQFMRPYCKPHTGKQIREGYPGCASVRYSDVKVARELLATARAYLKLHGPIV